MSRNPNQRDRSRSLRRQQIPAESVLWKHLRNRQLGGHKFRRQHPIGPFFVDLACHECKVLVEVDGESHLERSEEDEARSEYLREQGWLVMRFWNTQVYGELESVLEAIYRVCEARKPSPLTPNPSPPKRGRAQRRCPLTPNPSPPKRGRGEQEQQR